MFKELKETMTKVKGGIMTMLHQIDNIKKEIEIYLKYGNFVVQK